MLWTSRGDPQEGVAVNDGSPAALLSMGSTCRRIRYRVFSQPGGLWAYYWSYEFRIVLEFDPEAGSFSAVCPELPGCASAG